MRSFSFHAKTIGKERYLTYILGEGMELDEDTLDFLEDENPAELVRVIFEQDEDYDYLTYDISGKISLEKYTSGVVSKETVLKILRNVALGLIGCKEQALHLAYILLHKGFILHEVQCVLVQFHTLPHDVGQVPFLSDCFRMKTEASHSSSSPLHLCSVYFENVILRLHRRRLHRRRLQTHDAYPPPSFRPSLHAHHTFRRMHARRFPR